MKTIISAVLVLFVGSNVALEKRILKPGVNFVCNSDIHSIQNAKWKITNSIRNEGTTRLSVHWPEAGIKCTGLNQLPAKMSDSSSTIAQDPFPLNQVEVLFGNALQYREQASCYVDAQRHPKKTAHTVRLRHDQNGQQIFKIEVVSELRDSEQSTLITFRIEGDDLSLILPTRMGESFGSFGLPKANRDWEIVKANSLTQANIQPSLQADMLNWLGRTPRFKSTGLSSDLIVLKNKRRGNNEISFPVNGSDWVLQTVFLVAFTPGNEGFIGLAAEMHLPR